MWESMMGKSIIAAGPSPCANACGRVALWPADPSQARNLDGQIFQASAHALERRGFGSFDALETVERRRDAGARNDHDAVAIADHHIAGGDRNAAADDRQADRSWTAPLRR